MNRRPSSDPAIMKVLAALEVIVWLFLLYIFGVAAWIRLYTDLTYQEISNTLSANREIVENLEAYQQLGEHYDSKISLIAETAKPVNDAVDHLIALPASGIIIPIFDSFTPATIQTLLRVSKSAMDETVQVHDELTALVKLSELSPILQDLSIAYNRNSAQQASSVISLNLDRLEKFEGQVKAIDAIASDFQSAITSVNKASESIRSRLTQYLGESITSFGDPIFNSIASAANRFDEFASRTATYKANLQTDRTTLQSLSNIIIKSEIIFQRIDHTGVVPLANFVNRYALILVPWLLLVAWLRRYDFRNSFKRQPDEFSILARMSIRKLVAISETTTAYAQQLRIVELIEQRERRRLSPIETSELRTMVVSFERTVLKRAKALAILAYRGYSVKQSSQLITSPKPD